MTYREKVERKCLENYWNTVVKSVQRFDEVPSVTLFNDIVFAQLHFANVIVVGTSLEEGSSLMLVEEIALVARLLNTYLKGLSELTLRTSFSLVYQVLLEIMDYGYPLTTEMFTLEDLVPQPTLENKLRSLVDTSTLKSTIRPGVGRFLSNSATMTSAASRSVPWRAPDVAHTNNEILFDVIDILDYIFDAQGRLVKACVHGAVEANCHYSGMPDVLVRLGQMEKVVDVAFHRCVQLSRYSSDKAISFIPPEGKFTLMQYSCSPEHSATALPPFYVSPQISVHANTGLFNCMVGMRGGGGMAGRDQERQVQKVSVRLLLPLHASSLTITKCTHGTTSFERTSSTLTWIVGSIDSSSPSLSGTFVVDKRPGVEDGPHLSTTAAPTSSASSVSSSGYDASKKTAAAGVAPSAKSRDTETKGVPRHSAAAIPRRL